MNVHSTEPTGVLAEGSPGGWWCRWAFSPSRTCTSRASPPTRRGCAPLTSSSAADRTPKKNEAYLDRQSLALVDEALSTAIWRRLRPHLPDPLDGRTPVGLHGDGRRGAASQLKFYRYLRGHRFGQHVDQSWRGDDVHHNTEYTLLIYLNSQGGEARWEGQPLVGGDTVFHATAKTECARV